MFARRIALRSFLTFALLAVLLPIVLASGSLFYRSAVVAMEEFALQLADEVSGRVREKVVSFFDVPQRVVAFNVEQVRAGYLLVRQPDVLMRQFMLQIDQQPQLTFISMGMPDGQYYAGSRPPLGDDRAPRMLRARVSDGRAMEVLRVDPVTRQPSLISRSEVGFDARTRPWYQSAIANDGVSWYAPYRYLINDAQGAYDGIGMGISAPVRSRDGQLMGVVTADVALSQLNEFLAGLAAESGGRAFLAEASGELLAMSSHNPAAGVEVLANGRRTRIDQTSDPVMRALGQHILHRGESEGTQFMEVDGVRHLARWWTHALNRGPVLTMAIILPESRFNTPLRGVLRNTIYTTAAVMLASVLFSLFVASRLVRPLQVLSDWAIRLTQADWNAKAPKSSPIRELRQLADAMGHMAGHLKEHAEDLEQMVAQRTQELESAVASIEQTLTDQRHFIAMLSHEVRSPLAVINTAGQLLALRSRDAPAQQALAQRILRGSARLSYFFDNCLTQDRIDSHNFIVEPAPVDVGALCLWVAENGGQLSAEHPLHLEVEPELPALNGDPVLLRVMLMNVLSNAFKYSEAGTTVSLSVHREGDLCRFAIEDEGPGIPLEDQQRVFEKYRRGRTAEGKPGAGLGLALVKRIVDLHGGAVQLQARQPQGMRFVIDIPLTAVPVA
ncbi:ATP-binding protein [Acidovorax sp.]|uniref:ATP-binding protein n=1 Tax=Acidovorax sp. TaxID=1872122 RepID=UPI002630F39E|nr:ATP-binding protein [Acidovorax sp.]